LPAFAALAAIAAAASVQPHNAAAADRGQIGAAVIDPHDLHAFARLPGDLPGPGRSIRL
jgi:hypothetical protein